MTKAHTATAPALVPPTVRRFGAWDAASLALVLVTFALPAAAFLRQQSLWVDETTQLSGLTLGPGAVARWLAGGPPAFDVPIDRMPPMSYWLGWLWSRLFGLSEESLRWFGFTCTAGAVAAVWATARRAWGVPAATVAGLCFALSPNLLSAAPEIRAYPLFMLWTSLGFLCLMRVLENPKNPATAWLAGLTIFTILSIYTHFFGVLFAGAVFLALAIAVLMNRGKLLKVVLASACVAICSIGIYPFVKAAVHGSGEGAAGPRVTIREIIRFAYRSVLGHPVFDGSTLISIVGIAGLVILLVLAFLPKRRTQGPVLTLAICILAGSAVAIAAQKMTSSFEAMSPQYNLWRMPALCLLAGSALAATNRLVRTLAAVAGTALVAASLYAAALFMVHGAALAHCPSTQLENLVERYGTSKVAVVYVSGTDRPWGHIYFPLIYTYHDQLAQYVVADDAHQLAALPAGDDANVSVDSFTVPCVVLVETSHATNEDTAAALHGHPIDHGAASTLYHDLAASPQWHLAKSEQWEGISEAHIEVFERTQRPLGVAGAATR